ncbi:hypothetical protein HBDW_19190 [Herbaspirillum sp. DW155]|uniref:beta strand repeat-containing protein n=1 Tax=Herbaspirillum sp. DW155 TaxID=3095609 RepID=UPI0030935931|nr:hypothetical protein HBDW_19190 [Herbaspirillum sp. DW155]
MATITASSTGGNWSDTAAWTGGVVPTAADDVVLNAASGPITITTLAFCRSLDASLYANTLTHPASITLTIGDATAGANNNALRFGASMTYTLGDPATSALLFQGTASTQQTIDWGGKTVGNVSHSGVGASWAYISALTQNATASHTHTVGTLNWAGTAGATALSHTVGTHTCTGSSVRTANYGNATITAIRSTTATHFNITGTNLTFNGSSATFISSPSSTGRVTYQVTLPTASNLGTLILNGEGERGMNGTWSVGTLTRNGTANYYDQLNLDINGGVLTVTNALNIIAANADSRITIWPSSTAVKSRLRVAGATLNLQHVDIQDVVFDNGGNNLDLSTQTLVGDAGGNSMYGGGALTFLAATTQSWAGGVGSWNDSSKWTSRVPLVHDNVVINSTFSGSPTITANRKWLCRNITVGGSGAFTLTSAIYENYITGNMFWRSGVSFSNNASCVWCVSPRTNVNWTFNGVSTVLGTWNFQIGDGALTFADSGNIGAVLAYRTGEMKIPSGVTVGIDSITSNANRTDKPSIFSLAGVLQLRSGSGTLFSSPSGGQYTKFNDYGGRIEITSTASGTRTVAMSGIAFPDVQIAPSTGTVAFTGGGSLPRLPIPKTPGSINVTFAAGTATTLTSPGNDLMYNGSNVVSIKSATAGSAATISKAGGRVQADYVSLQDIAATGGAVFSAGANSTLVSGNSGWTGPAAAQAWIPQAA